MAPPFNTGMWWASNTRLEATVPGCTTTVAASMREVAATIIKRHVQLKTPQLGSASSKSCKTHWLLQNGKVSFTASKSVA